MKAKFVFGVGVNDAGYPVYTREVVGGKSAILWTCPFYRAWKEMIRRCHDRKFHEQFPTYLGCVTTRDWLTFSVFREWMVAQPWEGGQLDKDILSPGNKVYSPDSCVFVSAGLNQFMTDRGAVRGKFPIGVHWDVRRRGFKSQCNNPFTGKREYLGCFICPEEAHEAWRKRKHELACTYANMQSDPRIAAALRSRYAVSKEASHD